MYVKVRSVVVGRVGVCILCTSVSEEGGGENVRVWTQKLYLCCHTHIDPSVSRTWQTLPVWVAITDAPVFMRERGGGLTKRPSAGVP